MYLTTILQYMSYKSDLAIAEAAQREMDETIRKQRKQ